jgi:hypothetical protein
VEYEAAPSYVDAICEASSQREIVDRDALMKGHNSVAPKLWGVYL